MSKFTVFLGLVIAYVCLINLGGAESTSSSSGGGGVQFPKNVRIPGPNGIKIFRLMRRGIDDDDLFTEDENYFKKRQYDDYGHMRFGKRAQPKGDFDDYGHLRFGK